MNILIYSVVILGNIIILCSAAALDRKDNKEKPNGPCIGMDCLHGVLMHGDDKQGDSHKNQDMYDRLQRKDKQKDSEVPTGPCKGKDCMELINHGGEDPEQVHKMEQKKDFGPKKGEKEGIKSTVDMEAGMHGDDVDVHDPNKPKKVKEPANHLRRDPDIEDLHVKLHGGKHVDHSKKEKKEEVQHEADIVGDLESLLHGSGDAHDIHHREKPKEDKKEKGTKSGVLDPHGVFHGEYKIGVGGIDKDELEDFKAWRKEKQVDPEEGYTWAYISDSILSEIDMLKRRYLPKFWKKEENNENDDRFQPLDKDVFGLLDDEEDEEYEDDDMRHELEAIGKTRKMTNHVHQPKDKKDENKKQKGKLEI